MTTATYRGRKPGPKRKGPQEVTQSWESFLTQDDVDFRIADFHHGLSFVPDEQTPTMDLVREYLAGPGFNGVTVDVLARTLQRDRMAVKRALRKLEEDLEARCVEQVTRGAKASRRKVWYPAMDLNHGPLFISDGNERATHVDAYFKDSEVEHAPSSRGAGGGRAIRPKIDHD